MPPKIKITKDDIIRTALEVVRKDGPQALNARTIASALHCSTQPVFSNFDTMEELHIAVVTAAETLCMQYIDREVSAALYPPYKASGMAYIRFAKEEKELFRLLYMRDRTAETVPEESRLNDRMKSLVHQNTGFQDDIAALFHLEMWICVHGIATMFATRYIDLDWDLVSKILTDFYQGLRKRYGMED